MLGRNRYSAQDVECCRDNADALLAAWQSNDIEDSTLESLVFGQAVVALDAWFVHRLKEMEGPDPNPLTEVRAVADSIVGNGGTLRVPEPSRWVAARTVLRLEVGDEVVVTADAYERLAAAYLAAIERTFVPAQG